MTRKPFVSAFRVTPLLILLCLLLTGCGCKHQWNPATCDTPKTCSRCQITEGEALGHTWVDASCEAPKTCSACGATEGNALDHTWVDATCDDPKTCSRCQTTEGNALGHTWVDASCEIPKTCSICSATEGEALGHAWVNATCETPKTCSVCQKTEGNAAGHKWQDATTEAPKTCSVCQKTEGTRIITDSRFKTAACKDLFGTWKGSVQIPGSSIVEEGFTGTLDLNYTITFHRDGSYQEITTLKNKEQFTTALENYYADSLYKEFTAMGYNQDQANEAMVATYGMDVKAYAKKMAASYNWDEIASADIKGVYFVADGKLHSGYSWNGSLLTDNYSISGNSLSIESVMQEYPDLTLTRS